MWAGAIFMVIVWWGKEVYYFFKGGAWCWHFPSWLSATALNWNMSGDCFCSNFYCLGLWNCHQQVSGSVHALDRHMCMIRNSLWVPETVLQLQDSVWFWLMLRSFSLQPRGQQKWSFSLTNTTAMKSPHTWVLCVRAQLPQFVIGIWVFAPGQAYVWKKNTNNFCHSWATIFLVLAADKRWSLSHRQRHYHSSASAALSSPLPPFTAPALQPLLCFHFFAHEVPSA